MKKLDIYSGLPVGEFGAGKLLQGLMFNLKQNGVEVTIFAPSVRGKIVRKILKNVSTNIKKKLYRYNALTSNNRIRSGEVALIFHPQSLGLNSVQTIVDSYKKVLVYALDNFAWCSRSYNVRSDKRCVECLSDSTARIKYNCFPFPGSISENDYLKLQDLLRNEKIHYLFQDSYSQQQHSEMGFGLTGSVVGMSTMEFNEHDNVGTVESYDFVFHGGLASAKGIHVLNNWLKSLRNYSILIPYAVEDVKNHIVVKNFPNIVCKACSWETGLREYIMSAKAVLCPSIWDMPIEGALLKNLYYNGNVLVLDIDYGYVNELPSNVVIKANADQIDPVILADVFSESNSQERKKLAKKYVVSSNEFFQESIKNLGKFI